jgi:hypothetical protein
VTERSLSAALDDVMDSIDAYADDRSEENRQALRSMFERWAKLAGRYWAGLT